MSEAASSPAKAPGTIQVIERMMSLLDALAASPDAASLKHLAQVTDLHPSTAHRILAAMNRQHKADDYLRLVERLDGRSQQRRRMSGVDEVEQLLERRVELSRKIGWRRQLLDCRRGLIQETLHVRQEGRRIEARNPVERLVQVGLRDLCAEEIAVIEGSGGRIRYFSDPALAAERDAADQLGLRLRSE